MKQLGRVFLAGVLAVSIASPMPAAPAARRSVHHVSHFRGVPTFANSTLADISTFDDPLVRAAAVEGLGRYNGAVVAVDPNTGRILTVVNQKVAFGDGYIPCSTIKPTVAVAALQENVITRDTMLRVGYRKYMNLTDAMAHSNNVFFEELGRRMGFETLSKYARLLGLGELAGYNLPEDRRRVRAAGFDVHLVKPVPPEDLRRWLKVAACRLSRRKSRISSRRLARMPARWRSIRRPASLPSLVTGRWTTSAPLSTR